MRDSLHGVIFNATSRPHSNKFSIINLAEQYCMAMVTASLANLHLFILCVKQK